MSRSTRGLAQALRDRGSDAESCEARQASQGIPDDEQRDYAAQHGRAVLSFEETDFTRLDGEWTRSGREHAGIVLSSDVDGFGELLRRVERHLNTYPPSVQRDMLLWLYSSPTR